MRILFDTSSLTGDRLTGIGIYSRELYKALQQEVKDVKAVYKSSRLFKRKNLKANGISNATAWLFTKTLKDDILFGPDFKLLPGGRAKKLIMIHDLLVFEEGLLEEDFALKGRQELTHTINTKKPDGVICNSEYTASRFQYFFPNFNENNIFSIPLACDHISHQKTRSIDFDYILFVGTIEKRKNIIALLDAFEKIADQHKNLHLVLIGRDGHGHEQIKTHKDHSKFSHRIKMPGYVSDEELSNYYTNAKIFVYPSLYEGFGIPILEAMQAGVPVITSNHGAMKEVAGDNAQLVDAKDFNSIAKAIDNLLKNEELNHRLSKAGKDHAKKYSWQNVAQQTVKAFEMILNRGRN